MSGGLLFVAVNGLLVKVASLFAEHRLCLFIWPCHPACRFSFPWQEIDLGPDSESLAS